MKKHYILISFIAMIAITNCGTKETSQLKIRPVVDTVGFARFNWQMDSIMSRLKYDSSSDQQWKTAISPHDDYSYVGDMYPKVLSGIKAKTVILFGVAHKAKNYNLENKIIFDSFDAWKAPYGNILISEIRDQIITGLPDSLYLVHDEMQSVEHSLEALIPFLQFKNRNIEIVPVLIPYITYDKMQQISESLSSVVFEIMKEKNLQWGQDLAILISSDAVHYGDEDWGGKNYASYGTDSLGLINARNHEMEIITNCLVNEITSEKVQRFINYTVQETDYKEYKWTWCGRYAVPFGLLVAQNLDNLNNGNGLNGTFIGYSTSIDHSVLKVNDLKMGVTAPANNHHWVGYAAVGYK